MEEAFPERQTMKTVQFLVIAIITATISTGCSMPRFLKRGPRVAPPIATVDEYPTQESKSLFREMGVAPDLYKRNPSDSGAQSKRHMGELQAIRHGLEADIARMEAEATRVEMAKKLGIDYKPQPMGQPAPVHGITPTGPGGLPPGGQSPLLTPTRPVSYYQPQPQQMFIPPPPQMGTVPFYPPQGGYPARRQVVFVPSPPAYYQAGYRQAGYR